MFQNVTQILKNKLLFYWFQTEENSIILQQKRLSLLRGITSKHLSDFYCLNCLHSFVTEDTKILGFNQYQKSGKPPFMKYDEHIPSGFLVYTISSFRSIRNKHDVYRGKDWMKKFCESLRGHAGKIINSKKKKSEINRKWTARIIWKCQNLLHLLKKIK